MRILTLRRVRTLAVALAAMTAGIAIPLSSPVPLTQNFADVVADDATEYQRYQIKLTYLGRQTKSTPSLMLVGDSRTPAADEFGPHQDPGVDYSNDEAYLIPVTVSGTTIQRFVELGLGTRPELQVDSVGEPMLSVMVQRGTSPNDTVWESLSEGIDTRMIVTLLRASVQSESVEVRELARKFRNWVVGP